MNFLKYILITLFLFSINNHSYAENKNRYVANYAGTILKIHGKTYEPIEYDVLNSLGNDIQYYQDLRNLKSINDIILFFRKNYSNAIEYEAMEQLSKAKCKYAGIELNNPLPPYHPNLYTRYWLHPNVRCLNDAEKRNYKYYIVKIISKKNSVYRNNPIGKECYLFLFFDSKDQYQGHIAAMK